MMFRVLICVLFYFPLGSQNDCYQDLIGGGLKFLSGNQYEFAMNKFVSARFCLDKTSDLEIDSLIRLTQQRWEEALNFARIQAVDSAEASRMSRDLAKRNERRADSLLKENLHTTDSLRRVREDLILAVRLSESHRLILNAQDIMYSDPEGSLLLSMEAYDMEVEDTSRQVEQTFMEAVYLNLVDTLYANNVGWDKILYNVRQQNHLLLDENGSCILIKKDGGVKALGMENGITCIYLDQEGGSWIGDVNGVVIKMNNQLGVDHKFDIGGAVASIQILSNHTGIFSTQDGNALLWNGSAISTLSEELGVVYQACYLDATQNIVARGSGSDMSLYDQEGRTLRHVDSESPYIYCIVPSFDGSKFLTISANESVVLWNGDGDIQATFTHPSTPIAKAVFSEVEDELVTADTKGVNRWSHSGELIARIDMPIGQLDYFESSPNAKTLYLAMVNGQIFNLNSDSLELNRFSNSHSGPVKAIEISPDQKYILTTGLDRRVKLWSASGHLLLDIAIRGPNASSAYFSADGDFFFFVQDNRILLKCPLPEVALNMVKALYPENQPERVESRNKYDIKKY